MVFAFAGAIGVAADQEHRDQRSGKGKRGHQAEGEALSAAGGFGQHLREPQKDPVGDDRVEEIDRTEQPYAPASQASRERRVSDRRARASSRPPSCA